MDDIDFNWWADFWRYEIGCNIIPADSVQKRTFISWKNDKRGNWQVDPIPQDLHDEWKAKGSFEKGMAIICGRIFHNDERKNLYLCAIDADNRKGIECLTEKGLVELSKKTMVEQHADNPDKAHIYFYTTKPMQKKSSDAVNLDLLEGIRINEIPSLEVKGLGTHGIMYCTPSPHKDGSNYEIIGIKTPMIFDHIGEVINKICDEYSLGRDSNNKVPMKLLLKDDTIVVEGANRHEAIMRYAERLLRKYPNLLEEQVFRDIIMVKNKRMCYPPLTELEIEKQIADAVKYIARQIEEEKRIRDIAKHKYGTDEFWSDVQKYKQEFKPTKQFIMCLDCKKKLEADPLNRTHDGHKVILV